LTLERVNGGIANSRARASVSGPEGLAPARWRAPPPSMFFFSFFYRFFFGFSFHFFLIIIFNLFSMF
jgi:hypothetical protein